MSHFINIYMKKYCFKCNLHKPLTDFNKCKSNKDGLQRKCRICESENHRRRYADPNLRTEKIKKTCVYNKTRRNNETPEQREYRLNAQKSWYEDHKVNQKEYRQEYMQDKTNRAWALRDTPKYRIAARLRQQTRHAFKKREGRGYLKRHTKELLGVSNWEEAKRYLESLFKDGMNWDNMHLWHIDHIRPISSFDLDDSAQLEECFNIKNLQPLWAIDNIKKSNKY